MSRPHFKHRLKIKSQSISCGHPKSRMVKPSSTNIINGFIATGLKVKGDPIAIEAGLFNYPFEFHPYWLVECNGFLKV